MIADMIDSANVQNCGHPMENLEIDNGSVSIIYVSYQLYLITNIYLYSLVILETQFHYHHVVLDSLAVAVTSSLMFA